MQPISENSALKAFWEDQNQKLLSDERFLSQYGNLFSEKLYFKNNKGTKSELDFSVFEQPHLKIEKVANLTVSGESYPLTMTEYAKLSLINSIMGKRSISPAISYRFTMQLAGFLHYQGQKSLSIDNIEAFHHNFLSQTFNGKGMFTCLQAPAFRSTYGIFNFVESRNSLQALGVSGLIDIGLTRKMHDKALDNACQTVMGIAINEYKKGGSYNFLTLEIGQYYIDHMRRVYEDDYFYSLVCRRAIEVVYKKIGMVEGQSHGSINSWRNVLLDTIRGTYKLNKKRNTVGLNSDSLNSTMMSALFNEYQHFFEKVQSLREENIYEVIKTLGLELRFDALEVIRILMLQKYYPYEASKKPEAVWCNYLSSLNNTHVSSEKFCQTTAEDIYILMRNIIEKQRLDEKAFMKSLNHWYIALMVDKNARGIVDFISETNRVSDAMTCLLMSWLGYRKSEFGFPLSAIHAESNLDILDNSHVPFRFKLKWVVPKTNGTTKLDREITSQCYQVAAQLDEFHQPPEGAPCLYKEKFATSNKSEVYTESRVKSNWSNFVWQYKPFKQVIELQRLSQIDKEELTPAEKEALNELSQLYNLSSARAQHLLETCKELRRDIVILNCTYVAGARSLARFKVSLLEYQRAGNITDVEHRAVVENYLSDDTKAWLREEKSNLDKKAMMDIFKEMLQGVRYPTPHAFRHIWAEAVLMRYQGDVGAAIRHQFCHLDDSFFMAYLRNKEARDLLSVARPKILNSIVDTLLIDSKQIGRKYIGGFARFVGKTVGITNAITPSELRALKEKIAGRVISLNSAQYATCAPREGGESRAKCSEFGEINPHNAKPSFCLDCTNALITEGNLRGIWEVIQPFIKESLNEDVMGFMVEHHLPTMRSAEKRIGEFQSNYNGEQITKMLGWIRKAIDNIEKKLNEEECLYAC
ncbi:hypothetical protein tloyanaT_08080 [Thalassotalea loyana]|uniref:Tyr recombinase domain-containing protein n=1 Tax=Thalassotalea loyana TaxID=280483 RepID=A0ABQ6HCE3_9GAMM|nr:hypothetical protein [Thalassotalea loyana]GLX84556.1 hypothetical protein tloyanaT_08080 [Thalassotalea loyana]